MTSSLDFRQAIAAFRAEFVNDPIGYARVVHGMEPDDNIRPMFEAVARGDRQISVRSGRGVGKTRGLSLLVSWYCNTRWPWRIVMTAPTAGQLWDGLWPEIRARFAELNPLLREMFIVGAERIELAADPDNCFISPRSSSKERPEALQGLHSPNMFILVDEASGVADEVFTAGLGSMSEENACVILTGNPTRRSGFFYRTHSDPGMRESWTRIHVSALESKWVTRKMVEEITRNSVGGINSNDYRVHVLGEFPLSDDDVLIPRTLVEAAFTRDIEKPTHAPVWGLDPARFGRDVTVFTQRWGNYFGAQEVWPKEDIMQTAGRVRNRFDLLSMEKQPVEILIDVIGIGSGLCDRLREFPDMRSIIKMINVTETSPAGSRGYKMRDHLWLCAYDWFESKVGHVEKSELLADELSAPTYDFMSDGRYVIESKDKMKARGVQSPNRADSFNLTFASKQATLAGNKRHHGTIKSKVKVV